MGTINQLRYWAYKILPLAYDDSLSYYEVLNKVTSKLNEVIDETNKIPENIQSEVTSQLDDKYAEAIEEQVSNAISEVTTSANEKIDELAKSVYTNILSAIATNEGEGTYTPNEKQGGELIWLNGILYEVVVPMTTGTNYVVGTNVVPVDIADELARVKTVVTGTKNEYYHNRSESAYDTGVYLYWKDSLYKTTKDISVNDILYDSGVNQNLMAVNLGNEITNNYTEMHEADNNLQTQIDGNDGDIEALQNKDVNLQRQIDTNNTNINNRVDNIVAQSGNDNTEIVDARKEVDKLGGSVATSLGTAIRNQINASVTIAPKLNPTNSDSNFDLDLAQDNEIYYFNKGFTGSLLNAPNDFSLGSATSMISTRCIYDGNNKYVLQTLYPSYNNLSVYYSRYYIYDTWHAWTYHLATTNNIIYIGENENYTTLRDGLTYAYNNSSASSPITVYVKPGTYNLIEEFADIFNASNLADTQGIPLGNYEHIIFDSATYVTAIYESSGDSTLDGLVASNFNPFYNASGNYTIENLNIVAQDTRYCIHDERGGNGTYYTRYINCIMKYTRKNSTNQSYVQCIGGGLGEHAHIAIDGGYYENIDDVRNVNEPITYHNGYNTNADSTLFFKDVCLGNNGYFRLGCYGPSTTISKCYVTGCKMSRDVYVRFENSTALIKNFEVIAWNNEVTNSSNNTTDSITGDRESA